jgi:hypothetical protein
MMTPHELHRFAAHVGHSLPDDEHRPVTFQPHHALDPERAAAQPG